MAVYRVRLEAQDNSGHFRETDIQAPDEAAAREWCTERELRKVAYTVDDATARDLGDGREFGTLTAREKAMLVTHLQAEPYKIVSVELVKGG